MHLRVNRLLQFPRQRKVLRSVIYGVLLISVSAFGENGSSEISDDPTYHAHEVDEKAKLLFIPEPDPEEEIEYINPDAPKVDPPTYPGERYEALVPATLDLAERAGLALHALTEVANPNVDYEMYWTIDLLDKPPRMAPANCCGNARPKHFQTLPFLRVMSGNDLNLDREQRHMQIHRMMQGPDGLTYTPFKGRPWGGYGASNAILGITQEPGDQLAILTWDNGRMLGAFSVYAHKFPNGPWRESAHRLAEAIKKAIIVDGDTAYLFDNSVEPGWKTLKPENPPHKNVAATSSLTAHGLLQYSRLVTKDEEAITLAHKLMRYNLLKSNVFGQDGEFLPDQEGTPQIHFHEHGHCITAALEAVAATGDEELLEAAKKAYAYGVSRSEPLMGYFPIWLNKEPTAWHKRIFSDIYSSEACAQSDMIIAAIMLSRLGEDHWDDADRWMRNHHAESQLTWIDWVGDGHVERARRQMSDEYATTVRVAERSLGIFAGWPMANDFQGHPTLPLSTQMCCTINGAKALYHVWKYMLDYEEGTLRVNLLLNRASKWADINSHIPYSGQVDVNAKQNISLEMRLPEWVEPGDAGAEVDGEPRKLKFNGRYTIIGQVAKGQTATLTFPIGERTKRVTIQNEDYTLVVRGNTVVSIKPPGKYLPLYQRDHYRTGETLWKKVVRFVPEDELDW